VIDRGVIDRGIEGPVETGDTPEVDDSVAPTRMVHNVVLSEPAPRRGAGGRGLHGMRGNDRRLRERGLT